MKFDFWTFLFQIVNFAVLLFILKRLLFKPVREIMEKRRKAVNDALGEADEKKREAEKLKAELEEELSDRKKLRREAEAGMRAEVDEELKRLMEAARKDAENLVEKERALFEAEKRKFEGDLRRKAAEAASIYASNIFKDIADESIHRGILRKFQSEVEGIAAGISGASQPGGATNINITTAYPLEGDEAEGLRTTFERGFGREISLSFETDASLIAGIAVRVDDRVHDFSLKGQIRGLKERLGGAVD